MTEAVLLTQSRKVKAKSKLEIGQLQRLDKLAREIRSLHETAGQLVMSAKERAREALSEAILCGKALTEAKGIVGHGGWLKWLTDRCKGVSHDTASRYMRLANNAHVRNLTDANGLRQAYITVGILDESEPEPAATPATPIVAVSETLAPNVCNVQTRETTPNEPSITVAKPVVLTPTVRVNTPTPEPEAFPMDEPNDAVTRVRSLVSSLLLEVEKNKSNNAVFDALKPLVDLYNERVCTILAA